MLFRQGDEVRHQLVSLNAEVALGFGDHVEAVADSVDCGQERVRQLHVQQHRSVPEHGEQVLALVGHVLQVAETKESAGALDGVHGPEDRAELVAVFGVGLKRDKRRVEPVERFCALHQELLNYLVFVVAHGLRPLALHP